MNPKNLTTGEEKDLQRVSEDCGKMSGKRSVDS